MVSQEKVYICQIRSAVSVRAKRMYNQKMYECHVCSPVSQIYCEPNFPMDCIEQNTGGMHCEYMTVLSSERGHSPAYCSSSEAEEDRQDPCRVPRRHPS